MKYLNFILTVIAALLAVNILVSLFPLRPASAGTGITNVNIEKIAGRSLYERVLEVRMKE